MEDKTECPFCSIAMGQGPAHVVFEDPHVIAFLSLGAIRPGHLLIVPRGHVDRFEDVTEPAYSAVFRAAQPLARALREVTSCVRVGTLTAGWDVPHFHLHLVPMFDYHDLDPRRAQRLSVDENERIRVAIVAALDQGGDR